MGDRPQDEERLLGTVTHLRRSQVAFYVGLGLRIKRTFFFPLFALPLGEGRVRGFFVYLRSFAANFLDCETLP